MGLKSFVEVSNALHQPHHLILAQPTQPIHQPVKLPIIAHSDIGVIVEVNRPLGFVRRIVIRSDSKRR